MLGRDHALLGAAAILGTLEIEGPTHVGLATSAMALVVGVGAALAPDLDEPNSLAGRANPVSHVPGLFGPHRRRTHSLLCMGLVVGLAAWAARGHPLAAGILAGFLACAGAGAWSRSIRKTGIVLAVPIGAVVGWVVASGAVRPGAWLPLAVTAGLLSHLVGDGLTPGGVPWLWPLPWRGSLGLFRTGSGVERWLVHPILWIGTAYLAYVVLEPVVAASVHHLRVPIA